MAALFAPGRHAGLGAVAGALLADPVLTLLCYVVLTQLVKMWLIGKKWL